MCVYQINTSSHWFNKKKYVVTLPLESTVALTCSLRIFFRLDLWLWALPARGSFHAPARLFGLARERPRWTWLDPRQAWDRPPANDSNIPQRFHRVGLSPISSSFRGPIKTKIFSGCKIFLFFKMHNRLLVFLLPIFCDWITHLIVYLFDLLLSSPGIIWSNDAWADFWCGRKTIW